MKVFVTGATGYIGSAVVAALLEGGHRVTGMGRSKARAAPLEKKGMTFVSGELSNAALLTDTARAHEAVIHAASDTGPQRAQVEAAAVKALLEGARAGGKAFVYTSGIWVLGNTGAKPVDETVKVNPLPLVAWRPAVEKTVLLAGGPKLRACVVRPGVVYGSHRGILSEWWAGALEQRTFQIVGFGKNRWPLVHCEDLGMLFRRVLEKGVAGAVYHGTDDTAHTVLELAEAVAKAAGANFRAIPLPEAQKKLGPYADALAADQHVVSPAARALGWSPRRKDFVAEAPGLLKEFQSKG